MNTILKNKVFIVIVLSILCLKLEAQFLDRNYYLVDSIESASISKDDREMLDEHIKVYRSSKYDTVKIRVISELVENLQDEKIWIRYNRLLQVQAQAMLKDLTDDGSRIYYIYKSAEALALNNFGYYYFNYSNRFDLALAFYNQGMEINEKVKNYDALIHSYSNVGNTYQNQGDLNKALIYYHKALALESKASDKLSLLAPLNNVAQVYYHLNDTIKALQTLKKAFSISQKSDNNFLKASLLHNIGSLAYFKGDPTGIRTLEKALAFRKQIGDKKGTLQTTLSLAGIENKRKNYTLCENYLKDATALVGQFPNTNVEGIYHYQLGSYLESKGETVKAIDELEKAVFIYNNNQDNVDMTKALDDLLDLYGTDNRKYALKKLEAYELQQKVLKNIDKSKAQKLLLKQQYEEDLKISEAKFKFEQELKDEKNKAEKRRQQLVLITVCLVLLVVVVFSFFIFRALRANKQKNRIISDQKTEVENQKQLIEEKHKDITDSITYAHRIQSSLIPTQQQLSTGYANMKVLFKPKDIVSGDFYWYSNVNGLNVFALADCTGHGVPGAFMSIIGINCLNTLITEANILQPAHILNELKKGVVKSLNSDSSHSDKKDGMDVALISFTKEKMIFSGANQSVLVLRNNELVQLKGNKQPIGLSDKDESFTAIEFALLPGDRIILFSDGLVDQFGGAEGKKLKIREFKNWLLETATMPLAEQVTTIEDRLSKFMNGYEQTDDITLAVIEI